MIDGPIDINAELEANRQSLLRAEARAMTRGKGRMMHFIPDDAEFDVIEGLPGGGRLLRLRDKHKALRGFLPGEYGG